MKCPSCEHDNIPGVDSCEECGGDLAGLDRPEGRSALETSIMSAPLARLNPRAPMIVAPDTKVSYVVAKLCERRVGCVLVGTEDHVEGIFSERDVLLRVAHRYEKVAARPVGRFMTPDPEMLDVNAPIAYALNRMAVGDYRHVPVTREGRLDGIISLRNILGFLGEWYPDLIPSE